MDNVKHRFQVDSAGSNEITMHIFNNANNVDLEISISTENFRALNTHDIIIIDKNQWNQVSEKSKKELEEKLKNFGLWHKLKFKDPNANIAVPEQLSNKNLYISYEIEITPDVHNQGNNNYKYKIDFKNYNHFNDDQLKTALDNMLNALSARYKESTQDHTNSINGQNTITQNYSTFNLNLNLTNTTIQQQKIIEEKFKPLEEKIKIQNQKSVVNQPQPPLQPALRDTNVPILNVYRQQQQEQPAVVLNANNTLEKVLDYLSGPNKPTDIVGQPTVHRNIHTNKMESITYDLKNEADSEKPHKVTAKAKEDGGVEYSLGIIKDSLQEERTNALAKFCDHAIAAAPDGPVGFFIPNQNDANARELKTALEKAIRKAQELKPDRVFKICATPEELKEFKENKRAGQRNNLG